MLTTMSQEHEDEFRDFAFRVSPKLLRLAYAWSRDWHRAQDLVQSTLERMYVAWPRARTAQDPLAYARTVLVRLLISEQRRPWRSRETVSAELPEPRWAPTPADAAERVDVVAAVAALPARQRAVVLLRYVEDLPIAEVAVLLGCSPGTVKSQAHAALHSLRRSLEITVSQGA